jgi:signal transduction histidine kinase
MERLKLRKLLTCSDKVIIQDSSSNLMGFLVDDLLDFAQLNAGKFRKVSKEFDLKEAIEEVISIQKDKASMMGIKLHSFYQP